MNAIDDALDASDDESVIVLTQFHSTPPPGEYILMQKDERKTIDSDLILLDSQLTVNLFTNPNHVCNIRPASTPINVHCTDFGDTPVYFGNHSIANVLSLYHLGKKFKVTYDSTDRGGVFKVHTKQGVVESKPTVHGLHALNLKTNPEVAFLLVNDADLTLPAPEEHQLHVSTVQHNFKNFRANKLKGLMQLIASWA
jgi:hypothetical protein